MSTPRDVVRRYIDHFENQRYAEALGMLSETGRYILIGKTGASGVYDGREDLFERLIPLLGAFKEPPRLKFEPEIVDGNRAAIRASGTGLGAYGPYEQPYYTWIVEVEGDGFSEMIEFIDTVELECAIFGKSLVEATDEAAL